MRSVFTAGVLDVLLEQGVSFDYLIGTSAGSLCGLNFLSGQKGRTARINIDYCDDKDYISLRNRFVRDGVFNLDFVFGPAAGRWAPFDEAAYHANRTEFAVCATLCETGKAVYFRNPQSADMVSDLKASCSLPLGSKMIATKQGLCLDGGIADSIPYRQAMQDGCERVVVVRTQHRDYRKTKSPAWMRAAYRMLYAGYPALLHALEERPLQYNRQAAELLQLEQAGKVFVVAPAQSVHVGRMEQDKAKLRALYQQGLDMAAEVLPDMVAYLKTRCCSMLESSRAYDKKAPVTKFKGNRRFCICTSSSGSYTYRSISTEVSVR